MLRYLIIFIFIYLLSVNAEEGKNKKVKDGKKPSGKKIRMNERGDIAITIR